jgi:Putative Actinobacterial Holin-X, holin superfamily III
MVNDNTTPADQASLGELTARLSEQMSTLVRDELRLAQAETTAKAKKVGVGAGLFGGAGLTAVYGVGCLILAAILGLAHVVDAWLAAVIVGVALFAIAGVLALTGKKEVSAANSPVPQEAIAGVKADINAVREGAKR